MIDHVTIRVKDITVTKDFYQKALEPLGYSLDFEMTFDDGGTAIGFGKEGKIDTWFTNDKPTSGPLHLCWAAESSDTVDAFYKAAIGAGGTDNGLPGERPIYHEGYYGAFVIDPDGNNIEAVFHG